jgi:hypothetical protein
MKMDKRVVELLDRIGETFWGQVQKGARHYMEVNIGRLADQMGYADLGEKYRTTVAVVPLQAPRPGMKVRIDGRTFVGYAEYDTGIAVPGYLARDAGRPYRTFVPNDSMICNFT